MALNSTSLVYNLCMFLQKEASHYRDMMELGSQGSKYYIFVNLIDLKMQESSDFIHSFIFMLENIWHHYFAWGGLRSYEIVSFFPIMGPLEPKLNKKTKISFGSGRFQVTFWYHIFCSMKTKEYMESERSGIFKV